MALSRGNEQVGWAILGAGGIADREIAPAIKKADNSRLSAILSRSSERAHEFAERHNAQSAYDDYEKLLADPAVDAVYIATPNVLHARQALAAARAGKHVLCDKPLALSVPEAESVITGCKTFGVRLGLVFQTRNHEGMAELRSLISEGEIGTPVVAEVEMGAGRTLLRGWRTDPAMAGAGTTNNIGVHAYDLLHFLLADEVSEVSAMTSVEGGFELETLALTLLRFRRGTLGYVNVSQSVPRPFADITIHGTEGRVRGENVTRMNMRGRFVIDGSNGERVLELSSFDAYLRTVADFADAVLDDRAPAIRGLDGLRSAQLVDAVMRSVDEKKVVAVGE